MGWEFRTATGQIKGGPGVGVADVPAVRLHSPLISGAAQVATASQTVIDNWQSESYDTDGMHNSTNPGRITVNTSGIYAFTASIVFNAVAATGLVFLSLRKNGTIVAYSDQIDWVNSSGNLTITTIDYQDEANSGDYYEVAVYQSSGATRSWAGQPTLCRFSAIRQGSDTQYASKALPHVKAYRSAALNHGGTAGFTVIGLDAESFDNGTTTAQHDNVTNNTRIVCQESGTYHVLGQVSIANVAAGTCGAIIALNNAGANNPSGDSVVLAETRQPPNNNAGNNQVMPLSAVVPLVVGDYIELYGYQTTGSAAAYGTGPDATVLAMYKISETGQGASQLNHLSDVNVSGTLSNDFLSYNGSTGNFENRTLHTFKRTSNADGAISSSTSPTKFTSFPNTDVYGSAQFWDDTNDRLIVPEDGFYRVGIYATFEANGTGGRLLAITKNRAGVYSATTGVLSQNAIQAPGSFSCRIQTWWEGPLTTSDHVEFWLAQNSGASLTVHGNVTENYFWIMATRIY